MNKALTISLIIPVYNEERYLRGCLEAVQLQTVLPDEVIVVDNNCTDNSMAIAQEFAFVKIIKEVTPGLIAARNKGFNAAKGDILARIDSDVKISSNWIEKVKQHFTDNTIAGVSGIGVTATIPARYVWQVHTTLWSRVYFASTEAFHGIPILWGANMAICASSWRKIKDDVCLDDKLVHEDQDLSFLLAGKGLRVVRDNTLTVLTRDKSYFEWYKYKNYYLRRIWTRRYHRKRGTLTGSGAFRLPVVKSRLISLITYPFTLLFTLCSFIFGLPAIIRHHLR